MHNSERNMIEDADVELLEAMLDNELTAEQGEQLRARLGREPKLAAELEQLRSERKLRAEMFSSLEGGDEDVVKRILAQIGPAMPDIGSRFGTIGFATTIAARATSTAGAS